MPDQDALLDAVRGELGPTRVPPVPSPAEMERRLAEKPWLGAATKAAMKPRGGSSLGTAATVLGIFAIGIFGVSELVNSHVVAKRGDATMDFSSSTPQTRKDTTSPTASTDVSATAHVEAPVEPPAGPTPVEPDSVTVPSTPIDSLPDARIFPRAVASAERPTGKPSGRSPTARSFVGSDTASADAAPSAVEDDSLAAELALVHGAQAALRDSAPTRAEDFLAQHAARFPHGLLRDERRMLQALARCAQGDVDGARAIRADLEHTSPNSSHLRRLASSCAR